MITLPELSAADITALLNAPPRKQRRAKSYGWRVDTITNGLEYVANPSSAQKGGFEGKAGSKRRSRKGRTVTEPNGSRYYIKPLEGEISMYRPNSVV